MTIEEKIKAVIDVLEDHHSYGGTWIRHALKSALVDYDHAFVEALGCIEPIEEDDDYFEDEED
jgi:hypothetical protein